MYLPDSIVDDTSSPTEDIPAKSKDDVADELLDLKDHVNVIFIGHVGRSTWKWIELLYSVNLVTVNDHAGN